MQAKDISPQNPSPPPRFTLHVSRFTRACPHRPQPSPRTARPCEVATSLHPSTTPSATSNQTPLPTPRFHQSLSLSLCLPFLFLSLQTSDNHYSLQSIDSTHLNTPCPPTSNRHPPQTRPSRTTPCPSRSNHTQLPPNPPPPPTTPTPQSSHHLSTPNP